MLLRLYLYMATMLALGAYCRAFLHTLNAKWRANGHIVYAICPQNRWHIEMADLPFVRSLATRVGTWHMLTGGSPYTQC